MAITYDHVNRHVLVPVADAQPLDVEVLRTSIRAEEASEVGAPFGVIVLVSGLKELDIGIVQALTVELINNWQVKFIGTGNVSVSGGNLIGGIGGDPFVPDAGIFVKWLLAEAAIKVAPEAPMKI